MFEWPQVAIIVLQTVYTLATFGLAIIGFNALILSAVYLLKKKNVQAVPEAEYPHDQWPHVVVQLPIYNERHVVERLLKAASNLEYPAEKLTIQLLDDSDDDTASIAQAAVETVRERGIHAVYIRRDNREGYKAGALKHGLRFTDASLVAIFDADFVPQSDFLKRLVPYFLLDDSIGLVQARWAHINDTTSHVTRSQALALDSHFVVEQTARHRGGLFMNFSGTAGVWRRTCIEDAGGWQGDTLSEDIDLSYRAQLAGWRFLYVPEVGAPAEIPPLMMGFKRQQARWATGTVQCLRKLGKRVLGSKLSLWQKTQAMLHLGGYFIHPLMLLVLLLSLPLAWFDGLAALPVAGLGLAMIGPPLQAFIAQRTLYEDWKSRMLRFPIFMLLGVGITLNNTRAVLRAFQSGSQSFLRTPKFHDGHVQQDWVSSSYVLPVDSSTWIELLLSIYAAVTTYIAFIYAPPLTPFMVLYASGFAYVALVSMKQRYISRKAQKNVLREKKTEYPAPSGRRA